MNFVIGLGVSILFYLVWHLVRPAEALEKWIDPRFPQVEYWWHRPVPEHVAEHQAPRVKLRPPVPEPHQGG